MKTKAKVQAPIDRAKQIIVEIIRQAGGEFESTTKLYKTFYHAHLLYAKDNPGFLSDWPIARMPNGPGIQRGKPLLQALELAGLIKITERESLADCVQYKLTGDGMEYQQMPDAAEISAIKQALEIVLPKSPKEASDHSHEFSRSWREGKDGDILNPYLDMVPDAEYARQMNSLSEIDDFLSTLSETER